MDKKDIKEICKKYGINQKELAEIIGVNQDTFNNAVSSNKFSKQMVIAINFFTKIKELEEENKLLKTAINIASK